MGTIKVYYIVRFAIRIIIIYRIWQKNITINMFQHYIDENNIIFFLKKIIQYILTGLRIIYQIEIDYESAVISIWKCIINIGIPIGLHVRLKYCNNLILRGCDIESLNVKTSNITKCKINSIKSLVNSDKKKNNNNIKYFQREREKLK